MNTIKVSISSINNLRFNPIIHDRLVKNEKAGKPPSITGYHRIDGPGSGLSLPLVQRTFSVFREIPENIEEDPSWTWSKGFPRTIGFTINTGTKVTAYPFDIGKLAVESENFKNLKHIEGKVGEILPVRDNWLLKIMETLGLNGVKFVLKNIDRRTYAGGLGGSATASTTVALLANYLVGGPMSKEQIVALASNYENDLGVSITGTQEQWNVVHGGIADYVWFPFGRAHKNTGYADAMVRELLSPVKYDEVKRHMTLIHSGKIHASKTVNREWLKKIKKHTGYKLYHKLLPLAYDYAESIRTSDWEKAGLMIENYRKIRTSLCPEYMAGSEWLHKIALEHGAVIFPLGAGGGGINLVWASVPEVIRNLKSEVAINYPERLIEFEILPKGHKIENGWK